MVKTVKTQKTVKKTDKKVVAKSKTVKNAKSAKPAQPVATDSVKYTNMFAAYRAFWKRGFTDWRGTTSRSGYWWVVLANAIIIFALLGIYFWFGRAVTLGNVGGTIVLLTMMSIAALFVYAVAMIIPSISIVVRRLHDGGFSTWWVLLWPVSMLPYVGWVARIILLVFMLMPTRVDGNPYHKFNK